MYVSGMISYNVLILIRYRMFHFMILCYGISYRHDLCLYSMRFQRLMVLVKQYIRIRPHHFKATPNEGAVVQIQRRMSDSERDMIHRLDLPIIGSKYYLCHYQMIFYSEASVCFLNIGSIDNYI
jgi:hypothetical protein